MDGIKINYVKTGSGPKSILCLPGALGSYTLDIEVTECWQCGVTDQLLIGIVNMHATSLFIVSVEYMRPRPWEIPKNCYCTETQILGCWFFSLHKSFVMIMCCKTFVCILKESPLYSKIPSQCIYFQCALP